MGLIFRPSGALCWGGGLPWAHAHGQNLSARRAFSRDSCTCDIPLHCYVRAIVSEPSQSSQELKDFRDKAGPYVLSLLTFSQET